MLAGLFARFSQRSLMMQEVATATAEGTDENEAKASEGFRFFEPTTELAEAILKQNQRLVLENIRENYPPETEIETEDQSLMERFEPGQVVPLAEVEHQRQILSCQRLVAERLYHYLSSLAESPWAQDEHDFPIAEYIPEGMATMLG